MVYLAANHYNLVSVPHTCTAGVCKQWTGQLDWITGLDYWTALSMLSSDVDLQLKWAWVHIMLM